MKIRLIISFCIFCWLLCRKPYELCEFCVLLCGDRHILCRAGPPAPAAGRKMAEKTVRGTVKWFSARRGYGFITDEGGTDYFVHFFELQMGGQESPGGPGSSL